MAFSRQSKHFLCLCFIACFLFRHVLCQSATTTSTISTTSKHADIIFPTDRPTLNNVDVLEVYYDTPWQLANLTLRCKIQEQPDEWSVYRAPHVDSNGTYILKPVQKGMNIPQFPVFCQIKLVNSNDENQTKIGGAFSMSSVAGATATTYARDATMTASATLTGQSTASGDSTGIETGNSSSPTATQTGGAGTNGSGGIGNGAAIGIGVGVGFGVLAIAAIVFAVWWVKRSKRRDMRTIRMPVISHELNSQDTKHELGSTFPAMNDNFPLVHAAAPRHELDSRAMALSSSKPVELSTRPASYVRLDGV